MTLTGGVGCGDWFRCGRGHVLEVEVWVDGCVVWCVCLCVCFSLSLCVCVYVLAVAGLCDVYQVVIFPLAKASAAAASSNHTCKQGRSSYEHLYTASLILPIMYWAI